MGVEGGRRFIPVRVVSRKRNRSGVDVRATRDSSGTGTVGVVSPLDSEIGPRLGSKDCDKPDNSTRLPESSSRWNCSICGCEASGVTGRDVPRTEGEILLGQRNSKSQ